MEDTEGDDTITYQPVDTFLIANGPDCISIDTEVTVPHPMILVSFKTQSIEYCKTIFILGFSKHGIPSKTWCFDVSQQSHKIHMVEPNVDIHHRQSQRFII